MNDPSDLNERASALDDDLRLLGLYVARRDVMVMEEPFLPEPGPMSLAVEVEIGDVAFTKRVLNPEEDGIDDEFRAMAAATENDAWLDNRNEIVAALRDGKDILGGEDEE